MCKQVVLTLSILHESLILTRTQITFIKVCQYVIQLCSSFASRPSAISDLSSWHQFTRASTGPDPTDLTTTSTQKPASSVHSQKVHMHTRHTTTDMKIPAQPMGKIVPWQTSNLYCVCMCAGGGDGCWDYHQRLNLFCNLFRIWQILLLPYCKQKYRHRK